MRLRRATVCIASMLVTSLVNAEDVPKPAYPEYPSETPQKFVPATDSFDFTPRDEMIPMRDGVKLHTVILVPRNARHAPMLLTRTPYDAKELTSHVHSGQLASMLQGYDNPADVIVEDGYIRVMQDVRGKYGSEGDYVMNRPLHGPQNPTPVDDSTDTYDTIDWLVKNVPQSNGKVGVIGISYDGFEPLMAIVNPHPALKVAVPINPMVDGWRGDDWFHNGAFRQQNIPYIYEQVATRDNSAKWWSSYQDDYDLYMQAVSAGNLARLHGMEQLGFWNKVLAHPAYDAFWSDQAVDKVLAARPLTVPVMLVHSLWDQEDIYGAMSVYSALQARNSNGMVKLVMGPWHHGQSIDEGSSLGPLRFGGDTAKYFREQILRPFLAQYLVEGAPGANLPAVTAFETGTNQWRKLDRWPPACEQGCATGTRSLYLQPDSSLGFDAPTAGAAYSEYVSDPAHPVPFRARPIQPIGYSDGLSWPRWLVDDQREASGRTDVLTFTSRALDQPLRVSGSPAVHLVASTSGTDGDFVVKLIDVYPDQVPEQPELGGYQLAVSMDILRGRYREGFITAKPIKSKQPLEYRFALPNCNHVFLPGHRLMVQIQSSWFPLYDRNPQTFVPNIFQAQASDYRKATVRVMHSAKQATFIALPVVSP